MGCCTSSLGAPHPPGPGTAAPAARVRRGAASHALGRTASAGAPAVTATRPLTPRARRSAAAAPHHGLLPNAQETQTRQLPRGTREARASPATAPLCEDKQERMAGPRNRSEQPGQGSLGLGGLAALPPAGAVMRRAASGGRIRVPGAPRSSGAHAVIPSSTLQLQVSPQRRRRDGGGDGGSPTRTQRLPKVQSLSRQASVLAVCPFVSFFPLKATEVISRHRRPTTPYVTVLRSEQLASPPGRG